VSTIQFNRPPSSSLDERENGESTKCPSVETVEFTAYLGLRGEKKILSAVSLVSGDQIDQFRYIKTQAKTIDLSTRLWGINPTNSVFIPQSLVC